MGNEGETFLSKHRRTVLSGVVTPLLPAEEGPGRESAPTRPRTTTIQQTVYLPPVVHDQLRELAFVERVRMHAILMEGLDLAFRARGMKPIAELTRAP
jgi:hypothetical protein